MAFSLPLLAQRVDLIIDGNGDNVYGGMGSGAGGSSTQIGSPGSSVQFTIELQNEDNNPDTFLFTWNTPAGWTVTLDGHTSPWLTPQIGGNGTATYTLQANIPANIPGGSTDIIVNCRSWSNPNKVDSVKATVVVPRVDLVIEGNGNNVYGDLGTGAGGSATRLSAQGEMFQLRIDLQNEDVAPDSFRFSWTTPSGWAVYLDGNNSPWVTPQIPANGTASYYLRVEVPNDATPGSYEIVIDCQSTTNPNKVDSVKAQVDITTIQTDLLVDGDGNDVYDPSGGGGGGSSQKDAFPGSSVSFAITLQNESSLPTNFQFSLSGFPPSEDWRVFINDGSDHQLYPPATTWTTSQIPSNGSANYTLRVEVPASATAGDYPLKLSAHAVNPVADPQHGDSVTATVRVITARCDLVIEGNGDDAYGGLGSGQGGSTTQTGTPGSTLNFSIELQNEDANADTFEISWNTPPGWTVTLDGHSSPWTTPSIGGNASVTYTLQVTIPPNAVGGTTSITIDARSTTSPNIKVDSVRANVLVPRTDLVIEGNGDDVYGGLDSGQGGSASKAMDGAVGGTLEFALTLQNEDATADTFTLDISSTTPLPAGWSAQIVDESGTGHNLPWTTPPISADGSANYRLQITVPGGTPSTIGNIILNAVSTTNNLKADSVTARVVVLGPARVDLVIENNGLGIYGAPGTGAGGQATKGGVPGGTLQFNITLTNQDTTSDTFNLSWSAPGGMVVTLDGRSSPWTTPPIEPGGGRNYTLQVVVPLNIPTGVYEIVLDCQSTTNPTKVDSVKARVSIIRPADVWPMFHYEERRTGRSRYQGSPSANLKWAFQTSGAVRSSPAIRRIQIMQPVEGEEGTFEPAWVDVIYFGSNDKYLYSLDWNGLLRWRWQPTDPAQQGEVVSSPAVDDSGNVYFGNSQGWFFCIQDQAGWDPNTGQWQYNVSEKWSYNIGSPIRSAPLIGQGMVLVSADDGKVYAFYADGTLAWSTPYDTGVPVPPNVDIPSSLVLAPDGTILIGGADGKLHAIDPDNGIAKAGWPVQIASDAISTPAIFYPSILNPTQPPDPNTYFIYVASRDGKLYEVDPGGMPNWAYTIGQPINSSPAIWYPLPSPDNPTPSPDNRLIIVGADDGKLYAVKADGTLAWEASTGGAIISSPAIGSNGYVYVGSKDNKVYAFRVTDGAVMWVFAAPQKEVISSPAIGSDSTVYIGSEDGYLYAILTTQGWYAPFIEKYSDKDEVAPNGTITYTIIVGNQGAIPLYDVWVFDPLDPRTAYESAMPLPVSTAGGYIVWRLPALEPGQFVVITLTVRVLSTVPSGSVIYNTAYLWDIPSDMTHVVVTLFPQYPQLRITDENWNPIFAVMRPGIYTVDGQQGAINFLNQTYEWGDRIYLEITNLEPETTGVTFFAQNSLPSGYFTISSSNVTLEDDPSHPGRKRARGYIELRPRENVPAAPPGFPHGTPMAGWPAGWRMRREFFWFAGARLTIATGQQGPGHYHNIIYAENPPMQGRTHFIINNPLTVEVLGIPEAPADAQRRDGNGNWVYTTANPDMANPSHWVASFFCDFGDVQHNQASSRIRIRIHNMAKVDIREVRIESPDILRMNGNLTIIPHYLPDETDADYPPIPAREVRAVAPGGVSPLQQNITVPAGGYVDVDLYVQVPLYQPPADGYVWDAVNGVWVPNPNPPLGYRTWNPDTTSPRFHLIDRKFMLRVFWDVYRGPRDRGICNFSGSYWGAPNNWDPNSQTPADLREEPYRNLILRLVVPPTPSLRVDESVIDFGKIASGAFHHPPFFLPAKLFTVKNTGNINLLYLRADREHLYSQDTDPSVFLSRTLILTNIDYDQFPAIYSTAGAPGQIRKATPDSSQPTSAQFRVNFAFIPTGQPAGVYSAPLHIYEDLDQSLSLQRDSNTGLAIEPEALSNPILKVTVTETPLSIAKGDLLGHIVQWPAIARELTQSGWKDLRLAFSHLDNAQSGAWSLLTTRLVATPLSTALPVLPPDEWPELHIYDDLSVGRPNWALVNSTVASSTDATLFPPLGNPNGDPNEDPPIYIKHTEPFWFSDTTGLHLFWRGWAYRQNSKVWDGRIFYSPDETVKIQIGADAGYKNNPKLTIIPANLTPTATPWSFLFWFSGDKGGWQMFYNSNPLNPMDVNSWQADRKVSTPPDVTYARDPYPLWRVVSLNGQPTPIIELVYAGFLHSRGSMKILLSRYPIDYTDGRLTLSGNLLPFPRISGEVLQPNQTGTIYYAQHLYWLSRRDNPQLAPRIWVNNQEITGWRWDGDNQRWFVDNPTLGKIWLDTNAGMLIFQQPFFGEVRVEYSPRLLCLTTSSLTDAQPEVVVENSFNKLHPPIGQPGWQGQRDPRNPNTTYLYRDRIHIFWRRSHSPLVQGQVSLFHKAIRVRAFSLLPPQNAYGSTAFMDAQGTIWVKVQGGKYEWYPMDPLTGFIYFAPEDEGVEITLLFNNQKVVPTLGEESVVNQERAVPIDIITNESQLSVFGNYLLGMNGPYMDKIWLFWTSPKGGATGIYYETYSSPFWR